MVSQYHLQCIPPVTQLHSPLENYLYAFKLLWNGEWLIKINILSTKVTEIKFSIRIDDN